MNHGTPRDSETVLLNPKLLETLRKQFQSTQDGSGLTFGGYLSQLLETCAVDFNNCTATEKQTQPRPPVQYAARLKKKGMRYTERAETLAAAREVAKNPEKLREVMRTGRPTKTEREKSEFREQVKQAIVARVSK